MTFKILRISSSKAFFWLESVIVVSSNLRRSSCNCVVLSAVELLTYFTSSANWTALNEMSLGISEEEKLEKEKR